MTSGLEHLTESSQQPDMILAELINAYRQDIVAINAKPGTHGSNLRGGCVRMKEWINRRINHLDFLRICIQTAHDLISGVLGIGYDTRSHARADVHHTSIVKASGARRQVLRAGHVDHVMDGRHGRAWSHQGQQKVWRMQQVDFVPAEDSRQLELFPKRIVLQAGAKFFCLWGVNQWLATLW